MLDISLQTLFGFFLIFCLSHTKKHVEILLQDEDFVADKDDEGSPTDDSGEGESDASKSGEEKEVKDFLLGLLRFNVVHECRVNN